MPTVKIEIEEHSGTQWHTEMDIGFPINHHPKFNETSFEGTMAVMLVEYCKYRDDLTPDKLLEQIEDRVVELTRGAAAEAEAKKAEAALPEPVGEVIGPPAPPVAPVAQEETGHQAASAEAPWVQHFTLPEGMARSTVVDADEIGNRQPVTVKKRRGRPPRAKAEHPAE